MAWPYTIGLDGVATPAPALVKHAPLGDWVGGDRIGSTEQLEQPGGKQHAQRVAGGAVNDTSHFAISQTGTPRSEAGCRRRCRSEEHTSELQSLMRISYAVFCLKKKKTQHKTCKITTHIST